MVLSPWLARQHKLARPSMVVVKTARHEGRTVAAIAPDDEPSRRVHPHAGRAMHVHGLHESEAAAEIKQDASIVGGE
jgi:hypothetical protein